MTGERVVHVVVPEGIDDSTLPSGGNVYDRRLCEELVLSGWLVVEHTSLDRVPEGAVALVDGLVAVAGPDGVEREAGRLRVVVLLHMPFGERDAGTVAAEARVLAAATAVVTTSAWSRHWVRDRYAPACPVHVAEPGVDAADAAPGPGSGERLLCVAAVTREKGHHLLLSALAELLDQSWSLTCAGSLARDRSHAESVQRFATDVGVAERLTWTGALDRDELDKAYAAADLTVLASRAESWGMVVTESLARGVPVVATSVGGVPEAMGSTPLGVPGLLVTPGDRGALAAALREWLTDPALREQLREAALARRTTLAGWSDTAAKVAQVLTEVSS